MISRGERGSRTGMAVISAPIASILSPKQLLILIAKNIRTVT
jgi:hypothetical protein